MKLKPTLLVATLIAFTAFSASAWSDEAHHADAPTKGTAMTPPILQSDPSDASMEKPQNAEMGKMSGKRDSMGKDDGKVMPKKMSDANKNKAMDSMPTHDHMQMKH